MSHKHPYRVQRVQALQPNDSFHFCFIFLRLDVQQQSEVRIGRTDDLEAPDD
jgi:hypothetical protein